MRATLTISTVLCLLLICTPAVAQEAAPVPVTEPPDATGRVPELPLATSVGPDILSAIPADAFGFIATNNLQASYDNIMLFVQALGLPGMPENLLSAIEENLGQVDLNGPAAVILLDPQNFPTPPIALLFSASDPQAILEAHQAKGEGADEELPPGVVKGADGYLAVKNAFVVFAPEADNVAAVLAGQTPLQIMPAAKEAFDKGQIVLTGDIQRAAPFILQMLNQAREEMTTQMGRAGPMGMPQMAMAVDIFAWEIDMAKALIEQADKLTVILDINAEHAILTKRILFKADSPAAAFVNAQMGQTVPSYAALPGGSFLLAAASSIDPEQLSSLAETFLNKFASLPSLKETLSDEQMSQMISGMKALYGQNSSTAFTFNIGNPMTGMFNMVARYDVPDSAASKKQMAEMYQAPYMTAWMEGFGMPLKYIYTPAAENYSGVDIDTIKMEITPPEPDANADPQTQQMQMMMAQSMQMLPMMLGPDMTFRLAAPNDKQVLFVMGGSGRMERAINVAQGNGSVLADDPKIVQAVAKLPANRFAEAHLDLGQVVPMIGMFAAMAGGPPPTAPPGQAPIAPPISFSASAEDNTLRVDLVVPSETIRTLVQSFMAIQMQMMQQGGPAGPAAEPSEDF